MHLVSDFCSLVEWVVPFCAALSVPARERAAYIFISFGTNSTFCAYSVGTLHLRLVSGRGDVVIIFVSTLLNSLR